MLSPVHLRWNEEYGVLPLFVGEEDEQAQHLEPYGWLHIPIEAPNHFRKGMHIDAQCFASFLLDYVSYFPTSQSCALFTKTDFASGTRLIRFFD